MIPFENLDFNARRNRKYFLTSATNVKKIVKDFKGSDWDLDELFFGTAGLTIKLHRP